MNCASVAIKHGQVNNVIIKSGSKLKVFNQITMGVKNVFLVLIFSLLCCNANSQNTYFADDELKENGSASCYIKLADKIIIAGNSFTKQKNFPTVMCVDTLGNVLWDSSVSDTSTYANLYQGSGIQKIILGSDGFLYSLASANGFFVWKIDPANGNILWKKPIPSSYQDYLYLMDYDAGKFIVTYAVNPVSGQLGYGNKIAFINKLSGDTIYTKHIGNSYDGFGLAIDNQKNIYCTRFDSVDKLDAAYPHNRIWSKRYSLLPVNNYHGLYCDTVQNELFCFGNINSTFKRPLIVKVNTATGTSVSSYTIPSYAEAKFQSMVVKNNFLYINWRHIYVGGGTYPYLVTKYDKSSGTAPWSIAYSFTGVGSFSSHSGNGSSALSIDIDNNDDVYATGYYGDANYGPENWGIIKINGSGGNIVYEKTITDDSLHYNNISTGMAACVINNQPYFVGNLETFHQNGYERSKVVLVKLNSNSGNLVQKTYFQGTYKFPSRVLAIEKYLQNNTLVLTQVGRMVNLEMYDINKNIVWKTTLSKNYYLFGSNLSIASSGEIYVSGYSCKESSTFPYYNSFTDSISIFKLNNLGNIISNGSFYVNQSKVSPVCLLSDNNAAYIFYQKNYTSIFYRKYNGSSMSAEFNANIPYAKINPAITPGTPAVFCQQNYFIDQDATKLRYMTAGSSNSISEIDKTTLASTAIAYLPFGGKMGYVNYVYNLDPSRIIVCGSDFNNKGSIASYNMASLDTIWIKVLNTGASTQVIKCTADAQKNYLYTISSDSLNIVVRKIAVNNGHQLWHYTYNGQMVNQHDFPMDIKYDDAKGKLLVSGFQTIGNKRQALAIVLDSMGLALDTIIKMGTNIGNNEALCVSVLPDGTQWLGGYLDNDPETGFISEIESPAHTVWPGDANSDGIADNLDVLELGLHYTHTGPARMVISNAWQATFADYWNGNITNGKNMNHSDCNGDGMIDANDTLAIYTNYGLTHAFKAGQQVTLNTQLSIVPDQPAVTKGTWGSASVYLGDASNTVSNINGLAFTVNFDNSLIETNSVWIEYPPSFINTANQNLTFKKLDFANNALYTATTHTMSNNVNGNGLIAKLHYQIKSSLAADQLLSLGITGANQSTASGTIVPLTSGTATVLATTTVIGVKELVANSALTISPNPANTTVSISSTTDLEKVEIINLTGQVLISEAANAKTHRLNVEGLANGVYFVKVYNNSEQVVLKKLVIQKF